MRREPDLQRAAQSVARITGFPLSCQRGVLHADGLEPLHGLLITPELGWRNMKVTITPEPFARELVAAIEGAAGQERGTFVRLCSDVEKQLGAVELIVGGHKLDVHDASTWPAAWESFALSVDISPFGYETDESQQTLERLLSAAIGLFLALLPAQAVETTSQGNEEGARSVILSTRIERSASNRAACIQHYGIACQACGASMARLYGDAGDGLIEVHHLRPLSDMEASAPVDPVEDLIPLCPNCHSIAHTRTPPLTLDELKSALSGDRRPVD